MSTPPTLPLVQMHRRLFFCYLRRACYNARLLAVEPRAPALKTESRFAPIKPTAF